MPALLSIIVSTDGSPLPFEDTLVSVLANRPPACEVIVVHPRSYQDPYDLSDEVRFVSVPDSGSSADRINAGLEQAKGDVIHILRSGITVQQGWTQAPLRGFEGNLNVGSVSVALVHTERPRVYESMGVKLTPIRGRVMVGAGRRVVSSRRMRNDSDGPSLDAGFYRTSALRLVGGFRANEDLWSDVGTAMRLKSAGFSTLCETACRLSTSRREENFTGFRAATIASRIFWQHVANWLKFPFFVARDFARQLPSFQACAALLGHAYGTISRQVSESSPRDSDMQTADVGQASKREAA